MDWKSGVAIALALALAAPAIAQGQHARGFIYSCVKDGVRHYTAQPLPGAAECTTHAYQPAPQPAPAAPIYGRSFGRYYCTSDCSGHRAGYEWAARQGITRKGSCSGNSQSFIEGCWAYVEEREGE